MKETISYLRLKHCYGIARIKQFELDSLNIKSTLKQRKVAIQHLDIVSESGRV